MRKILSFNFGIGGGDLESREVTEKNGDPEATRLHVHGHVLIKRDGIIKTIIIDLHYL